MSRKLAILIVVVSLVESSPGLCAPGVTIVAWPEMQPGVVELHFEVTQWKFPGEGHGAAVYVRDELRAVTMAEKSATLDNLPKGRNAISVVLLDCSAGPCSQLDNPGARASVDVDGTVPCSGAGDAFCEDDNPCSLDFCAKDDFGDWWCEWGVTPTGSCCTSQYQCLPGRICHDANCGPCVLQSDCDDMLDCTVDRCEAGQCAHAIEIACCATPQSLCDDGDPCTLDDTCKDGVCAGQPGPCPSGEDSGMQPDNSHAPQGAGCCFQSTPSAPSLLALLCILLSSGLIVRKCQRAGSDHEVSPQVHHGGQPPVGRRRLARAASRGRRRRCRLAPRVGR